MSDKELKALKRFKLLVPSRDGGFAASVTKARQEHGRHHTKHLLHEVITYSYLGYRARSNLGSSISQIARDTGLHKNTVTNALNGLSDLVHRHGGKWLANRPPEGWFNPIVAKNSTVSMQQDEGLE